MMKAAAVLILLLGLYCCFFASDAHHSYEPQVDCSAYMKLSDRTKPKGCTLEYFPVCGSNGQTYTNKCLFCRAAIASQGKIHFKHYGKC
ncbi:serine protease inhibitor Kazal-type 6 [Podarcis lilfordi]|uniref:Serine protease inhibitor Kazal-type 6 n=2 Tax=Podarcis lilfordi TaxID=74358 RepID=A0AA35NWZ8_9SAUR|nr:serine protease inhibitor Kazal-type 6 [Podarcis lilfordi]